MLGSRIEDGRFGVFADTHCHLPRQVLRIKFKPSGIDLSEIELQRYGFGNFDRSLCIFRNVPGDFMGYGFGIEDIGLQVVVRLWIFPSVGYQRVGRLVDLFTRKRTADRRIGFLNFELRGDFF